MFAWSSLIFIVEVFLPTMLIMLGSKAGISDKIAYLGMGLIVVLGVISAGLSTLEGLIKSLGTTMTADLVEPMAGRWLPAAGPARDRTLLGVNRGAIALLAVLAGLLSRDQLIDPKLSVAIFAQNGVYAFFAAAFVPILFGMFRPDARREAVIAASLVAIAVHFPMHYLDLAVPGTASSGQNPGVAAADGRMDRAEERLLRSIAREMGLTDRDYDEAVGMFNPRASVESSYTVLGVTPGATDDEVKKAYMGM